MRNFCVDTLRRLDDGMVKERANHAVLQTPERTRVPQSARRALHEGRHGPSASADSTLSRHGSSNSSGSTNSLLDFSSSDEISSNGSSNLAPGAYHEPPRGSSTNHHALAMKIAFPVASFLLLAFCLALFLARRAKAKKANLVSASPAQISRTRDDEALLESLAPGLPPRFTYAEIEQATNRFGKKLGAGGYGVVYEGVFPTSGSRIAVKVFSDTSSTACRNGFCAEVMSIGEKMHRNLVSLQGFCVEDDHRMLVYELMEKGSLKKVLFGEKGERKTGMVLSWERRKAIAVDTARALAFLHGGGEQKIPVVHCDVKPENILLNESWVAKVSDFGLAKLLWSPREHHDVAEEDDDGGNSSTPLPSSDFSTRLSNLSGFISFRGVRGTLGYLAPEWTRADAGPDSITTASDVYSFGVVLLELVAGRRSMVPGRPFLLGYAFDILAEGLDLAELLDPSLQAADQKGGTMPSLDLEDVRDTVKVALWCLQEDLNLRPKMADVFGMLTKEAPTPMPPLCDYFVGSSHFFDEGDQHDDTHILFSDKTSASNDKLSKASAYKARDALSISIISGR